MMLFEYLFNQGLWNHQLICISIQYIVDVLEALVSRLGNVAHPLQAVILFL